MNNFIQVDPKDPASWGSSFWVTAHTVAAAFPLDPTETDKNKFKAYFDSFEFVLPCTECRENWSSVLEKRPLIQAALTSRIALCRWVLDVHNLVNEKLGKKTFNWKQLTSRFIGIEDTLNQHDNYNDKTTQEKTAVTHKYVLSSESSTLIPDTSLGIVSLKIPSVWRNAIVYNNKPPRRAAGNPRVRNQQQQQYNNKAAATTSRKKKCGCSKK